MQDDAEFASSILDSSSTRARPLLSNSHVVYWHGVWFSGIAEICMLWQFSVITSPDLNGDEHILQLNALSNTCQPQVSPAGVEFSSFTQQIFQRTMLLFCNSTLLHFLSDPTQKLKSLSWNHEMVRAECQQTKPLIDLCPTLSWENTPRQLGWRIW